MSISYNIYANNGRGGPVDYATPIGRTTSLTFNPPALAAPSDNTFAVRAFDASTGLEESNTDARVRIIIDSLGADVTALPNAPNALSVRSASGGGGLISWTYNPIGQGGAPLGFYVYLSPGTSPVYGRPIASIPFVSGKVDYRFDVTGLADGASYVAAVRAFNSIGVENNTTATGLIVADSTAPNNVDQLVASATFNQ